MYCQVMLQSEGVTEERKRFRGIASRGQSYGVPSESIQTQVLNKECPIVSKQLYSDRSTGVSSGHTKSSGYVSVAVGNVSGGNEMASLMLHIEM